VSAYGGVIAARVNAQQQHEETDATPAAVQTDTVLSELIEYG
jgi:hypothetical protein